MGRSDSLSSTHMSEKTALLLINTGSPDAPSAGAVRRYLAEFLSDPRVVELPRWQWWPILHGIVLRVRPAKSAERYGLVWTPEGSPLVVHTKALASALAEVLADVNVTTFVGMCYGSGTVDEALAEIDRQGFERLVVLPLFPQQTSQTTAASVDLVFRHYLKARRLPHLSVIASYGRDEAYLAAVEQSVRAHWRLHCAAHEAGGLTLFSFHGVPAKEGEAYARECRETAVALAARLGLREGEWTMAYQSRFGRDEWLQPYCEPTVRARARAGLARLDVVCPGFACDCLETLEEIGDELRRAYLESCPEGVGGVFHYIPCLNAAPSAVALYERLVRRVLPGA